MELSLTLNTQEIIDQLPYTLLCEFRYGSIWETTKVKRAFNTQFTEEERTEAEKIFRQCHKWYLVSGLPDKVTMTLKIYTLWGRLTTFCIKYGR